MASRFVLAILACGLALAAPARAGATDVDLALVLAIDVSGSIDEEEAALQRDGYSRALTDAEVINAIREGVNGRIALAYIEWSGLGQQMTVVDWRVIDGLGTAKDFVAALAEHPPGRGRFTSISGAIDYAVPMLKSSGYQAIRRAIDISGDGPNNRGRPVTEARADAIAQGITINGLPIVNDRPNFFGRPMPDLDLYYRDCVIGGPGALYVVAKDFQSFANAIRRKLILEISDRAPPARVMLAADRQGPPCDAGEYDLRSRFSDPN
jgi:Protein of unknown function (DUF1194)